MARPALRRQVVHYVMQCYQVSERRACRVVRQHRSVQYYASCKDPQIGLRARMREIAHTRIRYGYRRIHVLLRREGWVGGKQLIYRLYCEEQLQLRSKRPRRHKSAATRRERRKRAKRTISGQWTSLQISWPMAHGFEPCRSWICAVARP